MKRILPLLAMLILMACSGHKKGEADSQAKKDSINLVLRISRQNRLYTAEYQVHKIVTHDDLLHLKGSILGFEYDQKISLGDRKVAIPIDVTLKSYVDFANFTERNVERSGDFIHITLPDPRIVITASKVDHEGIRQYTSLFRSNYSDSELTDFTRQGVESILEQIPQMGILTTARESAAQTLIPLLTEMGYDEDHIVITFSEDLDASKRHEIYDNEGSVIKL